MVTMWQPLGYLRHIKFQIYIMIIDEIIHQKLANVLIPFELKITKFLQLKIGLLDIIF